MMERSAGHFYDFSNFHLDANDRLLLRDGEVVQLTPKAFEILLVLVRNNGHLMTKEELLNSVWPDDFVEESNLARNISTLRKALGDRHLIETVPRRGYRFAASVREIQRGEALRRPVVRDQTTLPFAISIAVLPFQPLGSEECDECLGLRLADAVITKLSCRGEIAVCPTSAVRKYMVPDQDPIDAAGELHVDAVLEGCIQQSGRKIRMTAQLLDAEDGLPLWGAQFDAQFTDLFAVEDSLSTQLVAAMTAHLTGKGRSLGAAGAH
jgi:DNA-binding winged helix-turn-helix (wHTH) protein